jgi:hypothetical protein
MSKKSVWDNVCPEDILRMNAESGCEHPPSRLYSWIALDGTLVIGCCDCGHILKGGIDEKREKKQ